MKMTANAWTLREKAIIRAERAKGSTYAEIAALLEGRTVESVKTQAHKMGLGNTAGPLCRADDEQRMARFRAEYA